MKIIKQESALNVYGVNARAFNVVANDQGRIINQKIGASRDHPEGRLSVEMRFDDECKNGHERFSITASLTDKGHWIAGGCLHDEIAETFPELAPLIKWHLCSTDGPLHYIANTLYHVEQGRLDYARSSAIWPEATDEQLKAATRETLEARLPALMSEFKAAMLDAGFIWRASTTNRGSK